MAVVSSLVPDELLDSIKAEMNEVCLSLGVKSGMFENKELSVETSKLTKKVIHNHQE